MNPQIFSIYFFSGYISQFVITFCLVSLNLSLPFVLFLYYVPLILLSYSVPSSLHSSPFECPLLCHPIFCIFMSQDIEIKKDDERAKDIKAIKKAWEDAQPGRAAKVS